MSVKKENNGAKMSAKIQRENALKRYYENPNYCLLCEKMILVKNNEKPSQTRIRKFCSMSHAATYNNEGRDKPIRYAECNNCSERFELKRTKNGFIDRKLCDSCFIEGPIRNKTKAEVFKKYKSWQLARSKIQKHARRIFERSIKEKKCIVCGYKLHVEVAHVKAVSEFSDEAKIHEINAIDNLEPLCPNHHWEYDNGMLNLKIFL